LPHDLVASFKSTLDEVRDADLLIHVVDISHPEYKNQMQTTDDLLIQMEMDAIDVILVFNKIDSIEDIEELERAHENFPSAISISCKKDEGIDALRQKIVTQYEKKMSPYQLELEHSQAGLISQIRKFALIVKEDYKEDRICLSLRLPPGGKAKINNILSPQEIPANS